jgi:hypothetical protein
MENPACSANTHEMIVSPNVKALLIPLRPLKKLKSIISESISVITSSEMFMSQKIPLMDSSPKKKEGV